MPPSTVYTAGYCNKSSAVLYRAAIVLGATILDIRASRNSRNPEWKGEALEDLMGGYYRACPAWGNLKYATKGAPVRIADFEAGFRQFEQIAGPVIILCYCPKYHQCHRAEVARIIYIRGYETKFFPWEEYQEDEPSLF